MNSSKIHNDRFGISIPIGYGRILFIFYLKLDNKIFRNIWRRRSTRKGRRNAEKRKCRWILCWHVVCWLLSDLNSPSFFKYWPLHCGFFVAVLISTWATRRVRFHYRRCQCNGTWSNQTAYWNKYFIFVHFSLSMCH